MTTQEAKDYFGSHREIARILNISVQAVLAWKGTVPRLREYELKDKMKGKKK